jgi:hypothetical protein
VFRSLDPVSERAQRVVLVGGDDIKLLALALAEDINLTIAAAAGRLLRLNDPFDPRRRRQSGLCRLIGVAASAFYAWRRGYSGPGD